MSASHINKLRSLTPQVIFMGSHPGIIQSMLDFDFLLKRDRPSVVAIITNGRKSERYFFGTDEILLPVYASTEALPSLLKKSINLFVNVTSGRRVLSSTRELIADLPNLAGGNIFAERVPEQHALELHQLAARRKIWIAGGSSVGMIIPGHIKLGAIGGVDARQLEASNLFTRGQVAVVATSGGMVNEIIRTVAHAGPGISFAVALGGERFPVMTLEDAILAAEEDPCTKAVAYFGELGGDDEYRLGELITSGRATKPIVAYIAGSVASLFETPPQFGHAKAMAATTSETAEAKADALRAAGATVGQTYNDFIYAIQRLPLAEVSRHAPGADVLTVRKRRLISSSLSYDVDEEAHILGSSVTTLAKQHSFAYIAGSMFLGRPLRSSQTEAFIDLILKLLVDHGPYVSGAVNTIVTARAGRDLVSSLAAGLLTIGPRFGGAINEAAATWLRGVRDSVPAATLVEAFASQKKYISGIGHKKYRVDRPDPRVIEILRYTGNLRQALFLTYAQSVEAVTIAKKGNLILNVDGAIAACLLDLLHEAEGCTLDELQGFVETELFNGLFVLSRSVGFMGHYFDQKRLDEGLLRLGDDHVTRIELPDRY